MTRKIRTRFAPSPTGFMHVGNARTALFAYLFAVRSEGDFILRIEDTDQQRLIEGSVKHIIESLHWLGIRWDEGPDIGGDFGPYSQSERLDIYQKYAKILVDKGLAYPEVYSNEEIQEFRDQAKASKRPFLYRRHRPENPPAWDGKKALRLRADPIERKSWVDAIRGDLTAGEDSLDDFIILKADGFPTYNFAHIIDDHEMQITHIVRGEEFLSSMPRFIALYEALDIEPPVFITAPPILNKNGGKKLSKRDGARDVLEYQQLGYPPAAVANFLATMGWSDGTEKEIFTHTDLKEEFDIFRIQSSGAKFDEERLTWISGRHIREMSVEKLYESIDSGFWPEASERFGMEYKMSVLALTQERLKFFGELEDLTSFFFEYEIPDTSLVIKKLDQETARELLVLAKSRIEQVDQWTDSQIENNLRAMVEESSISAGKLFRLIRVSVVGGEVAPGLFETIHLLGKDAVLKRITSIIEKL